MAVEVAIVELERIGLRVEVKSTELRTAKASTALYYRVNDIQSRPLVPTHMGVHLEPLRFRLPFWHKSLKDGYSVNSVDTVKIECLLVPRLCSRS